MRSVAMAAMLLASCGPGDDTVSEPADDAGTATSSSGGTFTGEVRHDVAGSADTTGDGASGCAAPLACGDDCLQWQWVLEGFGDDEIDALALAPDGTIFAAGQRGAQVGTRGDAVLVALGADGTELYTNVLFDGLGDPDQRFVKGVAVRSDGLVAVLGELSETPYVQRMMVVELHGADGAPVQQLLEDGGECSAGALAFVGDGGLVVAGVCDGMGLLRKYDADLVVAWEKHGDLPAGLFAVELLEPVDDDLIVGGRTSDRFGLARLRPDGSAAWSVEPSIPELEPGLMRDLAVTPEGEVIAVGVRNTIEDSRWVARFDGASGLQWSRLLESRNDLSGLVGAVVDAQGRIFVTGGADVFELDGEGEIVGCWQHESSGDRFRETHAIAGSAEVGLLVAGSVRDDIDRTGWVARMLP
jgi:hypothetical protein